MPAGWLVLFADADMDFWGSSCDGPEYSSIHGWDTVKVFSRCSRFCVRSDVIVIGLRKGTLGPCRAPAGFRGLEAA